MLRDNDLAVKKIAMKLICPDFQQLANPTLGIKSTTASFPHKFLHL